MLNDGIDHNIIINIVRQKSHGPKKRLDGILYMVHYFRPEYLDILETVLEDKEDHPDVRSAAALALGKVGGDRALELLIEKAHTEDVTVKNYSVQALGMLGRPEGIPSIIDALKDQDNVIFASAAEALGRLGKPAVPALIDLLKQGADDARCVAAWQLGELRYMDAIPTLIEVIRSDRNTDVLALCIWALGEIGFGPNEVLEVLNWAREQEDPAIHERAARAIKKIARHVN